MPGPFTVGVSTLAGPDTFEAPAAIIPTSPLPKMQYLVALNNGPLDDPANITSIATPAGTVGGPNVWTELTVEACDIVRGRQHELGRFEAGTCTLTVNNAGGVFNSWDTTGPYYNLLKPMKLLQVRARVNNQTYYRFTGHVTAIKPIWDDPVSQQRATIEAKDAFHFLNQAPLANRQYPNQIKTDGAVSYWRLNDPLGSLTAVYSLGGHTGTLQAATGSTPPYPVFGGAPPLLTTAGSGAASFGAYNGAGTGPWIDISGAGMSTGAGASFSAECWVQVQSFQVNGAQYPIFVYQNSGTGRNAWYLGLSLNNVLFGIWDNSATANNYSVFSNNTINDGLWHHVVGVYSGAALTIYVDGVNQGSFGTTSNITLAAGGLSVIGGGGNVSSNGAISLGEVAFYPLALTPTQIANHYNLGVGFRQASTGAQIGAALDAVAWPAGARSIDVGVQTCQQNSLNLVTTSSLAFMQTAETTEGGALFMDGQGRPRFISRQNIAQGQQYGNVQAWFGDDVENPATVGKWDAGKWGQSTWGTLSIPYQPGPDMGLDEIDIVNQSTMTRIGGVTQVANDLVSQSPTTGFGLRTQSVSGLLHLTDAASLAHANWIVAKFANPLFRMRTLHVNLVDVLYDTSKVVRLLGLDLMHRVKVNRYQVGFEQVGLIERWEEKITADSWDIVIAMSPTDIYPYWLWSAQ